MNLNTYPVKPNVRERQLAAFLKDHDGPLPSYAKIGAVLGCTKNAISGAMKRLRASGCEYCPEPKPCIKPIFGPFLPRRTITRLPDPVRKPLPAHKRVKGGCQYIPGEPSSDDACKCLAERLEGSSYCPEHDALCNQRKAA